MKIIFDVGANNGETFINEVLGNKFVHVYAFEPTPKLINDIKNKIKGKWGNLNNFTLIEKAVSDYNGTTKFNIAGQDDWGCSSLLSEFSDNLHKTWPGRQDLKFTESVDVEVITLKSFIEENNINHIDYLHIDTQGSDFKVLQGLGDYIRIVSGGKCEVADRAALYKGSPHKDEVIKFLNEKGFKIDYIENEHHQECDLHFSRV